MPFWAKDVKVGFSNINAMAETIDTKPAFREAFQRRGCLVPVDNFYEKRPPTVSSHTRSHKRLLNSSSACLIATFTEGSSCGSSPFSRSR